MEEKYVLEYDKININVKLNVIKQPKNLVWRNLYIFIDWVWFDSADRVSRVRNNDERFFVKNMIFF